MTFDQYGYGPTIGLLPLPWRPRHMGERPRSAITLGDPKKDENRAFFDEAFWDGVEDYRTGVMPSRECHLVEARAAGWDAARAGGKR